MRKFLNVLASIRWRLVLIYMGITVVVFILTTMLTTQILQKKLLDDRISEYSQEIMELSVALAPELRNHNASMLYSIASERGRALSGRVLLVDQSGVVQVDSYSMLNGTQVLVREVAEVLTGAKDSSFGYHQINDEKGRFWAVYYTAAVIEKDETIGVVVLSQSIQDVIDSTNVIKTQFFLIFAGGVLVIFVLASILTRYISRPIEALTKGAMDIAGGNLSTRVNIKGNNELSELGNAFNVMTQQLENVDKQRSEFVSNASHELRTPLTSMKILTESILYQDGLEEAVYKDFLADINMEIDRLNELINDLLFLAKLNNAEETLRVQQVNLLELVKKAVKPLIPIANKRRIEVSVKGDAGDAVDCDPVLMQQAISNLVDNAIKYSREDSRVEVGVRQTHAQAFISIEDRGEGIPKEHLANLFERFYRVDRARARMTGGNGLGLHIVLRIVNAHGGRVDVKSTPGEGSVFTIIIPIKNTPERPEET